MPEDLSALLTMVLLLRDDRGTAAAGFAVSLPNPARLIIFLYFAGLVRHRNAAIG